VLREIVLALVPLAQAAGLKTTFDLRPGLGLRRRYGDCRHFRDGRPPLIQVRCTADGDRIRWRRRGAIVLTLVHEMAHLEHAGHGPSFWRLCRQLLDMAALDAIYDASDVDPNERASGDEKLAASAARPVALAARAERRARSRRNRRALEAWQEGDRVRLTTAHGPLSRATLVIVGKRRTRVVVQAPNRRTYLVPAAMLVPARVEQLPLALV
jgi:hypothetical protein